MRLAPALLPLLALLLPLTEGAEQCSEVAATHVLYNRVPKAASTSLKTLAANRAQNLQYLYVSSRVYNDRGFLNPAQEEDNVKRISDIFTRNDRVLYDQHIRYLNFTRFDRAQPTYINMVREPVARAVSTYYFARTGDHSQRKKIRAQLGEKADWSINECVARESECEFLHHPGTFNLMTSFFCGNDPICQKSPRDRLANAKRHLEQHFAVVGITEMFTETVELLEKVMPSFFSGSVSLVTGASDHKKNVNRKSGEKPTPETYAFLSNLARYDAELYAFALQLFKRRYEACFGSHEWAI